jgi:hypothetical protein
MNSENIQFWRPLAAGSKVVLKAAGTESLFNVIAKVENGTSEIWRHKDLMHGKSKQINANEEFTFTIAMHVFNDPGTGESVNFKAHVERPDGTTDPIFNGSWDFLHAGQFTILIFANNK